MYVLIFIVLGFHIVNLFLIRFFSFDHEVSSEILIISSLDLSLSCLCFLIVCLLSRRFIAESQSIIEFIYLDFFDRYKWLLFFIVMLAGYEALSSMRLILSGISRQELFSEYDRAGLLYIFLSAFFKALFPFAIFFKSSYFVKIMSLFGLLFTLIITASRSELLYVIYIFFVLLLFKSNLKRYVKIFILSSVIIALAVMVTSFLQGRPISDGLRAFYDISRNVFLYKSYSFFLAEFSIDMAKESNNFLFPFFGYPSEYIYRNLINPVHSIDSNFIGELHYLGVDSDTGRPYLANVLYPWWSWFYGYFGIVGLLLKFIYCFCILRIFSLYKMYFSFVMLSLFLLWGGTGAHPLLTLTHTVVVFVCIFLDFFMIIYRKYKKIY